MYLILDIARGIAALSVFIFHMGVSSFESSIPFLARMAKYGSLGVPLFFVISGYVITASAEAVIRHSKSAGSFLKRRFLRIYPPFWISIIVVVLLPYVMEAIASLKSGYFIWPSPGYHLLTLPDWMQLATLTKVFMSKNGDLQDEFNLLNSVYWTLAIEFQFYLYVYVALLFRNYFHLLLLLITLFSIFILIVPLPINSGLFIHFWPMFSVGILLYYLIEKGITLEKLLPQGGKVIGCLLTLCSIFLVVFFAYLDQLGEILQRVFSSTALGFAICSAFILWFSMPLESILFSLKNRGNIICRNIIKASAFMGVISYSLYLLHGKILNLVSMFVRQIVPTGNFINPIMVIVGTILICAVFYHYFERPFMSSKQKKIYKI